MHSCDNCILCSDQSVVARVHAKSSFLSAALQAPVMAGLHKRITLKRHVDPKKRYTCELGNCKEVREVLYWMQNCFKTALYATCVQVRCLACLTCNQSHSGPDSSQHVNWTFLHLHRQCSKQPIAQFKGICQPPRHAFMKLLPGPG